MRNANERGVWEVWNMWMKFLVPRKNQKDTFYVSYKFRERFNIKFTKPRDKSPEWRWMTERNLYLYNALITGLPTFQDCENWLADFGSRTSCHCSVQFLLVQLVEIKGIKRECRQTKHIQTPRRENVADQHTYTHTCTGKSERRERGKVKRWKYV